jgi:subtilisin family serine protease
MRLEADVKTLAARAWEGLTRTALSTLERSTMMNMKFPVSRLCAGLGLAFAMVGTTAHAAADTTRVVVTFKPGTQAAHLARAAIAKFGGKVKVEIDGSNIAVELPKAAAAALIRHSSIARVEEDALRYPLALTSPSDGKPYKLGQLVPFGIAQVQADLLKDTNAGNRKICIIDSGYALGHEDLPNGVNVTGDDDIGGAGSWSIDEGGHGTHVAGTIAAVNQAGTGVVGVLPNNKIQLHIVKVFNEAGWAYSSTLSAAARKCQAAGANVISMSLGGPRPNLAEHNTFTKLQAAGILSIAAAGNDGNARTSFPAGYAPVMSVAAVDENEAWASFSQRNKDVEISGPGVSVLSTVPMGTGAAPALEVGGTQYAPGAMHGSPLGSATAELADFGIGDAVDSSVSGKVCLIQRGSIDFSAKVLNCQNSGGVGAVIYNNVPGALMGVTLSGVVTTIPSMTASDTEGAAMLAQLGQHATMTITASNYAFSEGTSMATPHVSAVAALVWSHFPTCTGEQIRQSLNKSAKDLDIAGKDNKTGHGLVQAKAAKDRIAALGCGN